MTLTAHERMIALSLPTIPEKIPVWKIEKAGIDPIVPGLRHGRPSDLFWLWFAGNLSFTYIVIGAVVWSYGLSLWQAVLALFLGVSSFFSIGYLGIPGTLTGLPTMAYSARYFGKQGNRLMAGISWINMVGWETVVLIIASFTMAALLHLLFGITNTAFWLILALAISAVLELSLAFLGHATIELVQKWVSYIFGFLTLVVLAMLLPHVRWHAVISHHGGPWLTAFIPAVTVVIAVSALSWVTTAADYTRYLPGKTRPQRIISAATWGAIIPTMLLMLVGLLLGEGAPALAAATNPVSFLLHWLPRWAEIPYLLVTMIGILAGGVLCAYSSGLSLLATGIRIPRSRTIIVDALLSLAATLYVLLVSQGFLTRFEAFLSLIATLLAPWVAIALFNLNQTRRPPSWLALTAWLIGAISALMTTSTTIFTGPLALGVFKVSSLGYILGFSLTAIVYGLGRHLVAPKDSSR